MRLRIVPRSFTIAVVAGATSGCLLFTSVSDLGGGDGAKGAVDGANRGVSASEFNAAEAIAHGPPGLYGLAVDDLNVYWTNPTTGTSWRAAKGSTDAASAVAIDKPKTPGAIAVYNGRVYVASSIMSTGEASGLYSYAPDGSGLRQEFGYSRVTHMLSADALFLAFDGSSSADSSLSRFTADAQRTKIFGFDDDGALPLAFAYDGAAIYYYSPAAPQTIQRVGVGGGATSSLFVQEDAASDLLADTANLYALTVTGNLVAHPLAGGAPRTVASGLAGARRLAADDAAFYVSAVGLTPTSGRIVRIQKSDGAMRDLATNQASPGPLAVSGSGVYWANTGDGTVMRAVRK